MRARVLDNLVNGARSLELVWVDVIENSPVAGRTLAESALRTTAGVSVVAIGRTAAPRQPRAGRGPSARAIASP